jgi:lactoylglutathione lyase
MHLQELPDESDDAIFFGGHGSRPEDWGACIPAERFSHLILGVTNLDRSEAWYREVIGLDLLGRNLTAEPRPHSLLQMNTGQLLILVESEELRLPGRGGGVHHGFMLTPNQYRRAYYRLKELGYDVGDERQQYRAHGEYSIDVQDPDGHRFQLQCYGPEATHPMPGAGMVDCGPASKYKVGDVRAFKAGNFHLVRLAEGFLAVSRWCRHMNGLVVYQKAHWHFVCPFHDATYDRRGVPAPFMGNRARGPLHLHPITFSDEGHVLVDTDEVIQRTDYDPTQATSYQSSAISAAATVR